MTPQGYSFKTTLSWYGLRARLKELGHGTWDERDNDTYGTYITGKLWGVQMRIWDGHGGGSELGTYDPKGYLLLDYARSALDKVSYEQDEKIRTKLLPKLDIVEWKPDERND